MFFPAGLEADNDYFEPLSRSDFGLLREQAIAAGEPLRRLGITVSAGIRDRSRFNSNAQASRSWY
ncbi:hypothetical protein [Lysobacter enzymogenes]|uniref:hypothetical protein n=1 Tax=Lysobacter enzymogenes TaxID=69 RepID=UPI000F4CBD90|nr:hypothetical protein [Lysobacter enzymogenes]